MHESRAEQKPNFLAGIRAISPFAARPSALDLACFPARFCQGSGLAAAQACQDLLTVGTRLWGPGAAQTLLKVKIYEFAVYMDGGQVAFLPADVLTYVQFVNQSP